jgi:hypothetical protein
MSVEVGPEDGHESGAGTVAAVDEIDGRPHLVVADRRRDGAWVAIPEADAVTLEDWE